MDKAELGDKTNVALHDNYGFISQSINQCETKIKTFTLV